MAFVPTVESAQKQINTSRVIYQDALAAVAEGRAKLQAAVDSGQVQPGTQEYLNLKNQLVNSAESQAETAKMQYDADLSNLDNARAYAAGDTGVLGIDNGNNNYVAPSADPQVSNNEPPIVGAGDINVSSAQVSNTSQDNNPGFVYNDQGELVPADSGQGADSVPATELATIPKPVPSSSLADLQAASNTQDIANFGTTAPPVNLESDAVLEARNASNTDTSDFLSSPKPVIGDGVVDAQLASGTDSTAFTTGNNFGTSAGDPAAVQAYNDAQKARLQQTIAQQRKTVNNGDWRVKLRLAPQASYLYKSDAPGILKPLQVTDGIIFPYTPSIDTAYKANYSQYDLTHSNYRGYFYQNSYVDAINMRCTFTAQSTSEADYLLATIHFLKSLTKMFYGQDSQAGSPPPVVYLTGLGQYQFNEHPCLLQQFNYTLPADVDYVRAGSNSINNTNLSLRRPKQNNFAGGLLGGFLGSAVDRLLNAGLPKGGITAPPPSNSLSPNNSPTYVPTKMEIAITLLPIQSRQQVSKQFSVKQFANGDLLKGGFW